MKNKGNILLELVILIGVVFLVIVFAQTQVAKNKMGYSDASWNNLGVSWKSATLSVGVSATTGVEIAENRDRQWLRICNNLASQLVRIYPYSSSTIAYYASSTATAGTGGPQGITLASSTGDYCYEFGAPNGLIYYGPLYLIADSTTTIQYQYK